MVAEPRNPASKLRRVPALLLVALRRDRRPDLFRDFRDRFRHTFWFVPQRQTGLRDDEQAAGRISAHDFSDLQGSPLKYAASPS